MSGDGGVASPAALPPPSLAAPTTATASAPTKARERRAAKQRGRSVWPEFAVKVISTEKIREMGYEQNVAREIAILRQLSHPGVARMVPNPPRLPFPCSHVYTANVALAL